MARYYCNHCRGRCFCGAEQRSKGLTEPQSETNRTLVVPVNPLTNYEWAKELGLIPEDMTPEEFLNRPSGTALSVQESTIEW